MVEAEFEQIWQQLEHEASHEEDPEAARAEMEKERGDYRTIAERRVRLGLLLSEIGQKNGVEITQQEMNQLIMQAAQQYRPRTGRSSSNMSAPSRWPPPSCARRLFEDKVVDFLFAKAEISEREVSREELEAAIESEDGHVHGPGCGHDHDHGEAKPKKAAAKKAAPAKAGGRGKPAKKAGGQARGGRQARRRSRRPRSAAARRPAKIAEALPSL